MRSTDKRGHTPWAALEAALDAVADVPFAVAGVALCPPPVVRVHGVDLRWPLSDDDRRALREACSRSAFGDDGRTVLNDEVRSAWELEPEQFAVEGLAPVLEAALDEMARALGEGPLEAELYKLLHYERGDHFTSHRDGVKQPGMIGTLVIGLPGEHVGGELRVSLWGDEVRARLTSTAQRASFIGFYADCLHELRPVEQGYRTCLSFTVRRATSEVRPPRSAPADLVTLLERWRDDPASPASLFVPLAHLYPGAAPGMDALKGRDRAVVRALVAAAEAVGVAAAIQPLALERTVEGYSDDHHRAHWAVSLPGASPLPIASLVWPWTVALLTGTSISTYTGNEGEGYLDRYRTAGLMLRRAGPSIVHASGADWFEDHALAALLDRAQARRWRVLDLRPLRRSGLRSLADRVSRLGEHLETLVTPSFRWLASLRDLPALRELRLDISPDASAVSLPGPVMARLHSLELHAPREFPDGGAGLIASATSLRRLVIRTQGALRLPEELEQMPLRELRLRGEVRALPSGLGEDGRLEALVLHGDRMMTLPASVVGPSLRVLEMESYRAPLPSLARAPGLRRVRLHVVPEALPDGLTECRELVSLELLVPPRLRKPEALSARPMELPGSCRRLVLTHLDALPELSRMPHLEVLDVSHNALNHLPASVSGLSRLRELRAASNELTDVPDLSSLTRLRVLDLASNALTSVPALSCLRELEVLDLSIDTRSAPDARIDLRGVDLPMPQMRVLRLDGARLPARPSWLAAMTELQILELDDTGLAGLPIGPGGLPALRELSLDDNALTELPPSEQMPGLRILSLSRNPLRSAPRLSPLTKLGELRLIDTLLTELPIEPGDLPEVWTLRLDGCRLREVPRFDLLDSSGLRSDAADLTGGWRPELTPENVAILRAIEERGPFVHWDVDQAPIEGELTTDPPKEV